MKLFSGKNTFKFIGINNDNNSNNNNYYNNLKLMKYLHIWT